MNRIDRLRHIRKSALTQDETRTVMRQAKMNIWNQLKYPVTLQILEADEVFIVEGEADNEGVDENDWETVFVAQDVANLEFRLSAYHMPSFFTRMRLVDADGTTYEQSHADVADFNEAFNKKAKADLEPLNAFVKSAPERAAEIADGLITAALRSQHFTISPRSQVLLTHPNLHHLVFHEFEDCVVCRIHTTDAPADDTEPIVTISKPEVGSVVNSQRLDARFSFAPYEIDQGIQAFLILLCASIVRDFWVLEERARQQVYQKRTEKRQGTEDGCLKGLYLHSTLFLRSFSLPDHQDGPASSEGYTITALGVWAHSQTTKGTSGIRGSERKRPRVWDQVQRRRNIRQTTRARGDRAVEELSLQKCNATTL